jgi:hypothetical protein
VLPQAAHALPHALPQAGRAPLWNTAGNMAMGGVGGYFAGDDITDGSPWGRGLGAAGGALLMHPAARHHMTHNPQSGLTTAGRSLQGGIGGSFAGGVLDNTAEALGWENHPHFARWGGLAGLGTGAARGVASRNRSLYGAQGAPISAGVLRRTAPVVRGAEQFAQGGMEPLLNTGRAGLNWLGGSARPWAEAWQPATSWAQRMGRRVAGVGLGATALGFGNQMFQDRINSGVNQAVAQAYPQVMPFVQDDLMHSAHQFLDEHGMLNGEGQFNPLAGMGRRMAGGLTSGVDQLLGRLGVDPARMSPLQRLMVTGGAGGPQGQAGQGGTSSAAAAVLPLLMQQQQQPQAQGQPQQRPAVPGGVGLPVNSLGQRNEWQHQLAIQGRA